MAGAVAARSPDRPVRRAANWSPDLAKAPAGQQTKVMPYCYTIYVVRFSLHWSGILAKARLGRMSRSVKDS
jgi:hypothetical protein